MTLEEMNSHPFTPKYALVRDSEGRLRPRGHRMAPLCSVSQEGDGVCLEVLEEALAHPSFAAPLTGMVEDFVAAVMPDFESEPELQRCLTVKEPQELKAGGWSLLVSLDEGRRRFLWAKSKSRFWPFRR